MATTTNYNWTTPDDTDLVKDGAAAIRTLGSSADTTVGNLNPGTTAGDIDYYTTSTAKARVAIGTAGQVLQVNSGATAPEWATPASPAPASATLRVDTLESTTSTSYTALTTAQAVTLTTGTKVLVILSGRPSPQATGTGAFMSYAVSGATTIAINDEVALEAAAVGNIVRFNGSCVSYITVTAGSNTFTCQFKSSNGNNCEFSNRQITVIDLGS